MKHYFLFQKIVGLISAAMGVLAPIICDGDATISVFFLPIGIYLMITKKKCIIDLEDNQNKNTEKK